MPRDDLWTRPQPLAALRTYIRLPFGRLHKTNPEIMALARQIGRTPGALAMKASNFASLDPDFRRSGRVGLRNAGPSAEETWNEFAANPEAIAAETEEIIASLPADATSTRILDITHLPPGTVESTEAARLVRTRRVQSFFRAAVLTTYTSRCALSGIHSSELLVASHIIPWASSVERRADPRNGICLNALFDRAFDRGLFAFDDSLNVIVSPRLRKSTAGAALACSLGEIEGKALAIPDRLPPDPATIRFHRENVFQPE